MHMKSGLARLTMAAFALSLFGACTGRGAGEGEGEGSAGEGEGEGSGAEGEGEGSPVAPTLLSSSPQNAAVNVALNGIISATFSEPMNSSTLTTATFTLTSGVAADPVLGTVVAAGSTALFQPTVQLASNTSFQATITTGAIGENGLALASNSSWTFETGSTVAAGVPVNLGTAGGFAILAKSAISTVPTSAITGNIGISPAAASFITGFGLTADATNVFSTSPQITGQVFAADFAVPTPSNMTTAVSDMEIAFTDATSRAPDVTELGAGNIGGMTLPAGVYKWGTGLLIPSNVTLAGSSTDVWIFQIAQDLTMSSATNIFLSGGALAKNVFWQVSGSVELGTTAHSEGIILSQTAIALRTGASVNGRLLAQTAVTIDSSTIVEPAP